MKKDREPLRGYSEGAKIGMPIGLAMKTAAPVVALSAHFNEASDENARQALQDLPAMLDKVDNWIESGVLGGEQLNAADFQIAPSLGLAMTLDDLRPAIENRPAAALARRLVPNYPGRMPPVLPAEWLDPLTGSQRL
jgi:glutathione S-transferase